MNTPGPIDILLVEDNPDDLHLALRAFDKAALGSCVQVARDGAEALDFLFGEGSFADRRMEDAPKLILLDLKLPKIDGLEVIQRIKADHRTKMIPLVVLTSSSEECDVVNSYQLGVNSYITKPVDFEGFAKAVQELGMYWLLLNRAPKI